MGQKQSRHLNFDEWLDKEIAMHESGVRCTSVRVCTQDFSFSFLTFMEAMSFVFQWPFFKFGPMDGGDFIEMINLDRRDI